MKATIIKNIDSATIIASSENPFYTFSEALKDSRLSRKGKTYFKVDQWIKFSFASAISADTVAILGSNLSDSATVKIEANASDSWSSPSVSETLENFSGVWVYQFSSVQTYPFWRITLDDPTNPESHIEIGRVVLDKSVTFPGMSVNQVFKKNTTSEAAFSTSGAAYGIERTRYNSASFTFPMVTQTEKESMEDFFYNSDLVNPYLLFVWENSLDIQRPLYVVNSSLPEFTRVETLEGILWSFQNEIREVF